MPRSKPQATPQTDGPRGELDKYRAKRDPSRTPEPFGSVGRGGAGPGLFVVQKHAARRLHYDFRIELGGVLVSWAVPRGPSLDPAEKRMAVHVENHPLDYADFEGVIPDGNYGAGAVILWDRGRWIPVEDPVAGMGSGKLLFDLEGYKLRGRFTLVRTKRKDSEGNEWLMIKKPDGFADPARELPETSILSGLTVEEMAAGAGQAARIRQELEALGAAHRRVDPKPLALMLCKTREAPFSDPGWIYELKYDGYRLVAAARDRVPYLRYRRGLEATELFPEIAAAIGALPYASLVLDGEVVVFDPDGRPDFGRLQQRAQLRRPADIRRAALELPASLVVFDLLGFEGFDLRPLPLTERKRLLAEILPAAGPLRYSDHIAEQGEAFFARVEEMRLEGIVAKKADEPYRGIRSDCWLKIRVDCTDDFAVVGYSTPKGERVGIGALHLAVRDGDEWTYAGRVGTGFSHAQLEDLRRRLDALPRWQPGFEPAPGGGTHVWVEPELVVRVRYKEWTAERLLRQPAFLAFVADKRPEDCVPPAAFGHDAPPAPHVEADERPARTVRFTNLDKVFWPEEGYTKGDLIDYYRTMAPAILPYLAGRPVVLTRYPDGIDGKSFYQKDAPEWVPDWIRTETVWSEHAAREIRYFVCDDVETLVFLANLGTIPLHIWSSRADDLARPDWSILDLDPKGAPFADVIACARCIKKLCDDIELPTFVKTSGSTGLHVLIPLGRQCTYEQSRNLAHVLARIVEQELPDISTTTRNIGARGGKVYLDFLQNRHGQLLAAPFSVRPLPGAPVSTPLRWPEVKRGLDIGRHTMETVPRRVARQKKDPMLAVLDTRPDLTRALELLSRRARQ